VKKIALAAILFAAAGSAAMAANFWVVQDTASKKCAIVAQAQKPSIAGTTVIGEAHATRTEAQSSLNRTLRCGGTE